MKTRILIISALTYFIHTAGYGEITGFTGEKVPAASGFINITVESNINRLIFSYNISEMNLLENESGRGEKEPGFTGIIIPLKDFNHENRIAFNDFLSVLKADEYPVFKILIPDRNIFQCYQKDSVVVKDLSAHVAGVTRKYNVLCRIENINNDYCLFSGVLRINLSDLNIKPPVKYLGLVKVKNEVLVKFGLYLRNN